MFILPLMTGHLFWKATILGGLYRGVPLYGDIDNFWGQFYYIAVTGLKFVGRGLLQTKW